VRLEEESRSFASLRARPELESTTRKEESRSFAALRMTRRKGEGMTKKQPKE